MVGPVGVGEIDGAVGEGAGLQGEPGGIGRVGAGHQGDWDVGCAGNDETQLICLYGGALRLWIPEHGR